MNTVTITGHLPADLLLVVLAVVLLAIVLLCWDFGDEARRAKRRG